MSVSWTGHNVGVSSQFWMSIASDSTGTKLAACNSAFGGVEGGLIYTSTDSGSIWNPQNLTGGQDWHSIASSSDGSKLAAVVFGGNIYTSTDSGTTWTPQTSAGSQNWSSIASSTNGNKLAAVFYGGNIYTSTNSGITWTPQTSAGSQNWYSIASSSNGSKLAAVVQNGNIYTSTNSGLNWTEQTSAGSQNWSSIASSSNGTKLAAVVQNGYIYTSTDSGSTWTEQTSAGSQNWSSIASNSDGNYLAAVVQNGYIYISSDSGTTWTEQTSAGSGLWQSIASNSDGTRLAAVVFGGSVIYTGFNSSACYNYDTKILTNNGYVPIQDLKKGDLVQTYLHGYKPVDLIGKGVLHNKPNDFKECMYKLEKTEENGLTEDLIVTGGHSILVDELSDAYLNKCKENNIRNWETVVIDDKKLLLAGLSDDFSKLTDTNQYTYYHFTLEAEDETTRYGIYANGILSETPSKKQFLTYRFFHF